MDYFLNDRIVENALQRSLRQLRTIRKTLGAIGDDVKALPILNTVESLNRRIKRPHNGFVIDREVGAGRRTC